VFQVFLKRGRVHQEVVEVNGQEPDILSIMKNGKPLDTDLCDKLKMAVESMGGNMQRVDEAFCLVNSNSAAMFDGYRVNLATQQIMSPSFLHQQDLPLLPRLLRRTESLLLPPGLLPLPARPLCRPDCIYS